MAELETKATDASVEDSISSLANAEQREDCRSIVGSIAGIRRRYGSAGS